MVPTPFSRFLSKRLAIPPTNPHVSPKSSLAGKLLPSSNTPPFFTGRDLLFPPIYLFCCAFGTLRGGLYDLPPFSASIIEDLILFFFSLMTTSPYALFLPPQFLGLFLNGFQFTVLPFFLMKTLPFLPSVECSPLPLLLHFLELILSSLPLLTCISSSPPLLLRRWI